MRLALSAVVLAAAFVGTCIACGPKKAGEVKAYDGCAAQWQCLHDDQGPYDCVCPEK